MKSTPTPGACAASEQGKIVNVHTLGAEKDILALLKQYRIRPAIVYRYSSPLDTLNEMLAQGWVFT